MPTYVRVLSPLAYNEIRRRFESYAFQRTGVGISVFDEDCAIERSVSVCGHITAHYFHLHPPETPPLFWRFEQTVLAAWLPQEATFHVEETEGPNDDVHCHRDIIGLSVSQAKSTRRDYCLPPFVFVCWGDDVAEVDHNMLITLKGDAKDRLATLGDE